ncbi:hypothetical protein K5I29_11750 [Flavobacterium agricola]|uniref:Uncharacterized protein n=1 Tax=Flavobacterium agricola TaxID=2870839 RepID=A0ABY6LYQ7_9FLAO|nr:hypothetical protein [Flavobacterium agricola]UYW01127.1 hypothetical protein K5I29_11750 [Flavobacterium agricola]
MFFSYSGAVGFSSGDISSYLPSFSATMDFYEKTNSNVNLFNGISGASNDINGGYGVTFGHSRPSEGIGSNKVSFGLGGGIRMGESKTYSSSEIISNFKNYVKSIKP